VVRQAPRNARDRVVLLVDSPAIKAEDIARTLVLEGRLPFHALYFLEASARWWEVGSADEAAIRAPYEAGALEKLGIEKRLLGGDGVEDGDDEVLSFFGLAPAEGFGEIEILKKLLRSEEQSALGATPSNRPKIHYLAVDSSPRLLRDHIGLLRETFAPELESGDLLCAGVVADVFTGLIDAVNDARGEFNGRKVLPSGSEFLPAVSPALVTYLGNCLGNDEPDRESRLFSTVYGSLPNRPLELLVGVSVMRDIPDDYGRTWDGFMLLTPHHLLETKELHSSRPGDSKEPPEFTLPKEHEEFAHSKEERCPRVVPEPYLVSYKIEGQRYRFYYRLAFDLALGAGAASRQIQKPNGSLLTLYNIINYKMTTLVEGIKQGRLFRKVAYDPDYHERVATSNGVHEYAVFSAILEAQEGADDPL
jgi:Histidine-specific methyltransferase, SAM-dependent